MEKGKDKVQRGGLRRVRSIAQAVLRGPQPMPSEVIYIPSDAAEIPSGKWLSNKDIARVVAAGTKALKEQIPEPRSDERGRDVVPSVDGRWRVVHADEVAAVSSHDTQDEAIESGRSIIEQAGRGGLLRIWGENGQFDTAIRIERPTRG